LERFTPKERDCYKEDEIDLMYLPKSHGYRYEMSNCERKHVDKANR